MGIKVKSQTRTMFYKHSINGDDCSDGKKSPIFFLNPIDTPESCSQATVDVDTLTRTINDHPLLSLCIGPSSEWLTSLWPTPRELVGGV